MCQHEIIIIIQFAKCTKTKHMFSNIKRSGQGKISKVTCLLHVITEAQCIATHL